MRTKALFGCDGRRCHIERMVPLEKILVSWTDAAQRAGLWGVANWLWRLRDVVADYVDGVA
jgi:hypothetical protein